ncbi:ankyrin repeat domain-containing protein SOWAHA [Xenentodon cancila]
MVLTQESILSLLISEGGKVKRSDLVGRFKDSVDCVDAQEKERNKELFKTFVNNVAFVKDVDGVKYVVLKKMYQHLLGSVQTAESHEKTTGNKEIPLPGKQQRPPGRDEKTKSSVDAAGGEVGSDVSGADRAKAIENNEKPPKSFSPIELALQKCKSSDIRPKRMLNFDICVDRDENPRMADLHSNKPATVQRKPYALPLKMPPTSSRVESHKLKADADEPPDVSKPDAFRTKKRLPSVEMGSSNGSPQLWTAVRSIKVSEEPRDSRIPSMLPLEHSEHEWLVKCAAGHWSQVYGLLLRDNQLAEKKDFMSGFTALHWAAKHGNSEMLVKIIDVSRKGGVDIDVNVKAHGGYTPLHIAALHDQEYVMAMLVGEYGASTSIRDDCGKKAHHYLHKHISGTLREIMGESKPQQTQDRVPYEKEELELFPDLPKSLHSISRLFQPAGTAQRRKSKQRAGLYYVSENPGEEREASGVRQRVLSDVFL